jgi:hypothetical protein
MGRQAYLPRFPGMVWGLADQPFTPTTGCSVRCLPMRGWRRPERSSSAVARMRIHVDAVHNITQHMRQHDIDRLVNSEGCLVRGFLAS